MQPFVLSKLQSWKRPAKTPSGHKFILMLDKLQSIVERRYVEPGYTSSLTDYFAVPKGDDDVRLVYNGASCGLNQALWSPSFWLPFPRSASRLLDFSFYSADMDLGEMFLNFPLHEELQEYSGIDLTPFRTELNIDPAQSSWFRWTRNWMGAKSSPYSSVRFFYFVDEFIRGNRTDTENSLRWDEVRLNLPGSKHYDPSKPRVQKWNQVQSCIAADFITFVDDERVTASTPETCFKASRQVSSRAQYLGVQDAGRKRKAPTQTPGAWAGALLATTATTVTKSVTGEKWLKGRTLVASLWDQLEAADDWKTVRFDYKELERIRGYLGHLSMTFELLVPYLKGFHLVLAAHLNQRDADGWKLTDKAWEAYIESKLGEGEINDAQAQQMREGETYSPHNHPNFVLPIQHLRDDLYALTKFFSITEPPVIQDRSSTVQVVRYGFGDASGRGFGSTIQTTEGLKYRIGVWGTEDESESSNFKELENVVATVEEEARIGNLADSVLYFFTDNATVESALHKGESKSRRLFELVVRFRKFLVMYGTSVIVSHVSGKRMVAQGTDGVSRGNLLEGVGSGEDIITFIPLHEGALERHPPLRNWLEGWMGNNIEFLSPADWFERAHDHDQGHHDSHGFWRVNCKSGIYIWTPPPAAAETALEELRKAVIKRQQSTHVFICPRLLVTEWRKQLYKASDLVISINPGSIAECWPTAMLEPLTIGFVFPLLPFHPWQRRGTPVRNS